MEKTLYLCEKEKMHIIADEKSVLVKEKGLSFRRVPAREIGRVVIIGNVLIESSAITLWTENFVPVTFLSKSGEILAVVMKYWEDKWDKFKYQKIFLNDEWRFFKFKQFADAKRKNYMLSLMIDFDRKRAERYRNYGFKVADYKDFLKRKIRLNEKVVQSVKSLITGLLTEFLQQQIVFLGFDPHCGIINRRVNFGFVKDIMYMMIAERDRQVIMFNFNKEGKDILEIKGRKSVIKSEFIAEIINRFENRRPLIKKAFDSIMDDFFVLIREVNNG